MGARGRGLRSLFAVLCGTMLAASACEWQSAQTPSPSTSTESPAASPSSSPTSNAGPLQIANLPFHAGEVGLNYGVATLDAQGGVPPYIWSIKAGTFPPGLKLNSAGTATGSNTKAGKFSFTVAVSDTAGASVTKPASVSVYAAMKATAKCATKCVIGGGCTRCGGFGSVTGGMGPYTYRIAGGNVPRGMAWNALAVSGGFPTGSYNLAIAVSDQLGATKTVNANWSIYGPAKLNAGPDCVNAGNPPACTTAWSYSGGNPSTAPYVLVVGYKPYGTLPVPTGLPPGWLTSVKNGVITMSAGGIPCNVSPSRYAGYLTLALVDTTTCATSSKSNLVDLLVDVSNNC